jgi:hypothetical protein
MPVDARCLFNTVAALVDRFLPVPATSYFQYVVALNSGRGGFPIRCFELLSSAIESLGNTRTRQLTLWLQFLLPRFPAKALAFLLLPNHKLQQVEKGFFFFLITNSNKWRRMLLKLWSCSCLTPVARRFSATNTVPITQSIWESIALLLVDCFSVSSLPISLESTLSISSSIDYLVSVPLNRSLLLPLLPL